MNIDLTKDQAILLVAILDLKIPVCRPELEVMLKAIETECLSALVAEICNKNQPQ